jgi:hypothetical protein
MPRSSEVLGEEVFRLSPPDVQESGRNRTWIAGSIVAFQCVVGFLPGKMVDLIGSQEIWGIET